MWSLTLNDWQYNGKKRKEKRKEKSETLHRMTENAMVKRKRRNERRNLKPYIEWQKMQWLKEKGETKGEIWNLTSNDRQYNGKKKKEKPKEKYEALPGYIEWQTMQWLKEKGETKGELWSLHRMKANTIVKRKRRNQRGNLRPYIEWETIQWLTEKGETKGEIWSLTSNDRQYNG